MKSASVLVAWRKGGGVLELADGRRYRANTNLWMTGFEFATEDGQSLVRFRRIGTLPTLSSAVEIPESAGLLLAYGHGPRPGRGGVAWNRSSSGSICGGATCDMKALAGCSPIA